MKPKTPQQVCDLLVREGWHPGTVFYEHSRTCRNLKAELIRRSLAQLRSHTQFGKDLRALVAVVDESQPDELVEKYWISAIDALRALQRTSPIGTQREHEVLLGIAKNSTIVRAMLHAAESEAAVDPSWLAVFSAEGSPTALAIVERNQSDLAQYPKLAAAILTFRNALQNHPSPHDNEPCNTGGLPIDLRGKLVTDEVFWAIVGFASRTTDPGNSLSQWLSELTADQVARFADRLEAAMNRAYTYDLWGAAFTLLGGCSDDAFRDFRADLVVRGRPVFEQVLEQPDILANHPDITGDESLATIADQVYQEKMGRELQRKQSPLSSPMGDPFDFDDHCLMSKRYPKLHALRER